MARIEFDSVTKVYDDAQGFEVAVEEFDLDIEDGEFVVFVGPSGCGKSTLLRMVAGLESVTDGEIRAGDEVINEKRPRDRDIAMVFQDYALYPHKTVRGNMAYGLKIDTDLSDEEVEKRTTEVAEMMGIEELLDKKPAALSGGQQQRVATGRAIVREPKVFLFDEPLSNLDAKLRKHMRTELSRLHSELGITSIYVTHDQEEAMTMADRIVVIKSGTVQQVGPPKEIYHHPENRFVADFIGSPSMNFFDVDYDGDVLVHDGFEYPVSGSIERAIENSGNDGFVIGVRPEQITVLQDADSADEFAFAVTVDVTETVGSDNFLYLDLGGSECRVRTDPTIDPEEGDTVYVKLDKDAIHLFNGDTEKSLLERESHVAIEA